MLLDFHLFFTVLSILCVDTVLTKQFKDYITRSSTEFPFFAVIEKFNRGQYVCTGTLITLNAVITAASCFAINAGPIYQARIGSIKKQATKDGQTIRGFQIITHSKYQINTSDFDVALLVVEKPFSKVTPVLLPHPGVYIEEGDKLLVLHFSNNPRLHALSVLLESTNSPCYDNQPDSVGCVRAGKLSHGDIGSPLLYGRRLPKYTLHGVLVNVTPITKGSDETLFVRIADPDVRDFILEYTGA